MSNEPWHLNKSVPITFIFAIMCQTVALIWFVATLSNDVANNKNELARLEVRTQNLEVVAQSQAVMLARIDENIKGIREFLERGP
jgi:hypothetical protein